MEFIEDIFKYGYLSDAVVACILSGIACGLIGTYIVSKRTVFLAGGITHASFGGIGIAVFFGFNPILGALAFAVVASIGIEYATSHSRLREDSAIGIIWGIGMAIGAFFLSIRPGYTSGDLSSFLFGSIVTITHWDVRVMSISVALLVVGAALALRRVMFVAFDRDFARSAGINVSAVSYVMAIITAAMLVLSIHVMGIVLLISLVTIPVVTVNMFTRSYRKIAVFSSCLAVVCSLLGLCVSYYSETPSGPSIIFVLVLAFAVSKLTIFVRNRTASQQ